MSYPKFLEQLLETGNVSIETPDRPSDADVKLGGEILEQFESSWRFEWAETAPKFHQPVASWAAESLYRSCQLLLYRDVAAEEVVSSLSAQCPAADSGKPQQHYNVDLTFRFLPNLWRFTQREAEDDPLTEIIRKWCFRWPLSSVGAVNLVETDLVNSDSSQKNQFAIHDFWSHPSLAQGYVDRIIEHKDDTRLAPSEVTERIRAVAGDHPELFQSLQSKLLIKEQIKNEI